MRGKSHILLGKYLAKNYLQDSTNLQIRAFLIGCVQPDKNPATYLKGSLTYQWLRGHNFPNSAKYIAKLSNRLERRRKLGLFDHYNLGKLIHYVTDAFTYAHNITFFETLAMHRLYEAELQNHFIQFMASVPKVPLAEHPRIHEAITFWHKKYQRHCPSIETDCVYAFNACCIIMNVLFHSVSHP